MKRAVFAWALVLTASIAAQAPKKSYDHGRETLKIDLETAERFAGSSSKPLPESRFSKADARAKSFDWCKLVSPPSLRRQSGASTCWAHVVVSALEWNWGIRNTPGRTPELSAQPIIDRIGRQGAVPIAGAFEIILQYGVALAADYSGNGRPGSVKNVRTPYRIVGWGSVDPKNRPTVEKIKEALVKHGPLTASVFASPAFKKYKDGVFDEFAKTPPEDPTTHYVLIVGWDDAKGKGCWKIQNSWGARWGEHGFMWIAYGCNNIGYNARWLRAQSIHYALPADAHRKLKAGDRFPSWSKAEVAAAASKEASAPANAGETSGEEAIAPAEANERVGDRVWVRMQVAATGTHPQGHCDLYSEPSWRLPTCLIVRIPKPAFGAFNAADAKELRERFRHRKILAEGKIEKVATKEGDRLLLSISDPAALLVSED
jgi:hypothetical protein